MRSSGLLSASGVVCNRPCKLRAVVLVGDAEATTTLTVYDHASSGEGVEVSYVKATDYQPTSVMSLPGDGVMCHSGAYGALSAATGKYIVFYDYA